MKRMSFEMTTAFLVRKLPHQTPISTYKENVLDSDRECDRYIHKLLSVGSVLKREENSNVLLIYSLYDAGTIQELVIFYRP